MDELVLKSGIKRIAIKDDEGNVTGEISFNPADVAFAERFYAVYQEFQEKTKEYEAKAVELDKANELVDAEGVPVQFANGIAFAREVCEFIFEKIDELFGAGTSKTVFRDSLDFEMIGQFFEGITPFIQQARSEKTNRYISKKHGRVIR